MRLNKPRRQAYPSQCQSKWELAVEHCESHSLSQSWKETATTLLGANAFMGKRANGPPVRREDMAVESYEHH